MSSKYSHLQVYENYKDKVAVTRYITVTGQYVGFHKYEDAPDEVAFLRHSHRHVFKWEAVIEVEHNERELEFFLVKDVIEKQMLPFAHLSSNLGSCESQAERLLAGLVNTYGPRRFYGVTVSEDGENEGSIQWDPSNLSDW